MKVKIEIECEDAGELMQHLHAIIETVKVRSRGNDDHDFECGTHFSDNNCYGTHDVQIVGEDYELPDDWEPDYGGMSASDRSIKEYDEKYH